MNGTNKTKTHRRKTYTKSKKRNAKICSRSSFEGAFEGVGIPKIMSFGKYRGETFPAKLKCSLVYEDTSFTISPVSGNGYYDRYVFRGNGPYDPDFTGFGSQPYYYDNLAAIYNRYRVIRSKITVTMFTTSADTAVQNIKCTLFPYQLSSDPTYSEYNDLKRIGKCRYLQWNQDRNDFRTVTMSNSCSTDYFTDNPLDEDWEGGVSDVPDSQWYWQFTADTSGISAEVTINFDVKIVYECVFKKRVAPDES